MSNYSHLISWISRLSQKSWQGPVPQTCYPWQLSQFITHIQSNATISEAYTNYCNLLFITGCMKQGPGLRAQNGWWFSVTHNFHKLTSTGHTNTNSLLLFRHSRLDAGLITKPFHLQNTPLSVEVLRMRANLTSELVADPWRNTCKELRLYQASLL